MIVHGVLNRNSERKALKSMNTHANNNPKINKKLKELPPDKQVITLDRPRL